jgi:hypothetical protein
MKQQSFYHYISIALFKSWTLTPYEDQLTTNFSTQSLHSNLMISYTLKLVYIIEPMMILIFHVHDWLLLNEGWICCGEYPICTSLFCWNLKYFKEVQTGWVEIRKWCLKVTEIWCKDTVVPWEYGTITIFLAFIYGTFNGTFGIVCVST